MAIVYSMRDNIANYVNKCQINTVELENKLDKNLFCNKKMLWLLFFLNKVSIAFI